MPTKKKPVTKKKAVVKKAPVKKRGPGRPKSTGPEKTLVAFRADLALVQAVIAKGKKLGLKNASDSFRKALEGWAK